MTALTSRFAARATAALLATATIAGLTSTMAVAAPADPANAAASAATTTSATANPGPAAEADTSFTKGTAVAFRNDTASSVWVREHHIYTDWYAAEEVKPGQTEYYSGNFGGVDDVQLRIFRSAEDARGNSMFKAIEVDAENPAWSSPWLSVSYHSKYYNVGTVHTYESALAGAQFTGKRNGDSSNFKEFELHMTKGWS